MKKGYSLFLVFILCSMNLLAQQQVQQQIDGQYLSQKQKSFLYQVSPELKVFDTKLLEQQREFQNAVDAYPKMVDVTSTDTSWSYSEYKGIEDSMFIPQKYTHYFTLTNGDTSTANSHQYIWDEFSSMFGKSRIQTSYIYQGFYDSVITLNYYPGETDPYTGFRYRYSREPVEGADYEQFYDYFQPGAGWINNSWFYSYKNENGWDTLRYDYNWSMEDMDYLLSQETRQIYDENKSASEYTNYNNGYKSSYTLREVTAEYELYDQRYYDSEENITSWYWEYLKLIEGGGYDYHVSKAYSTIEMKLVNEDSTQYLYADDNSVIESQSFYWDDSVYVFYELYRSFETEISEEKYRADSVIIYDVIFDEETSMYVEGEPNTKSLLKYDENGNQIEVETHRVINDTLQVQSRVTREFTLIGDYYYATKQETFSYDYNTGDLYRSNENKTNYQQGVYTGNSYFSFSAEGDTTYGYRTQIEIMADGSRLEIREEWDYNLQEMVLKSYSITNRPSYGNDERSYFQSAYVSVSNGGLLVNRTLNGYNSYPGIFNDGPILVALGDTVSLYVSARNTDMTIPDIQVTNMPSTATFDPETHHFFWIVDEETPSPMTYTATRGDRVVTTEVEFTMTEFSVPNEEENSLSEFRLNQNYPNPFNPSTTISFNVPEAGLVSLKVFNMLGQEVATLVNDRIGAGSHQVTFDASNLASGVYIYRIQTG